MLDIYGIVQTFIRLVEIAEQIANLLQSADVIKKSLEKLLIYTYLYCTSSFSSSSPLVAL